jgi:hypothetical protein
MKRRRGRATGCWLEVKKPHLEEKEEAAHQSVREDAQPVHHGAGGRRHGGRARDTRERRAPPRPASTPPPDPA